MIGSRRKHDWNSWENYLLVHETTLNKYINTRHVAGPRQYTRNKLTDQNIQLSIEGLILKSDLGVEIQIKIEKTVELDIEYSRPRARTFSYSYHALTPKPNARNLMRYCSPHEHRPHHHKHLYYSDGTYNVLDVPDRTWPHVSEFLDEVLCQY